MSFSSFTWNEDDFKSRSDRNPYDSITICLLSLLTIISFKTYLSGCMPKVSYCYLYFKSMLRVQSLGERQIRFFFLERLKQ